MTEEAATSAQAPAEAAPTADPGVPGPNPAPSAPDRETLYGLLARYEAFGTTLDEATTRVDAMLSVLREKLDALHAKVREGHALMDEIESVKL